MTDTRGRIAETVADAPGIHFSALVRRLDLAPGQVQYHLRTLREEGRVVAEAVHGRTHYFESGVPEPDRQAIAILRRETARDIVAALFESGPAEPAPLAADLDIARSTLEYHLDRLVDADLVDKRRTDERRVTLTLARPAETVELLAAVEPSVSGRLVDRFERLVDSLLRG